MHYRKLGKSEMAVSEIGLGCNRLGENHQPDSHWVGLVSRAVELGVTLFDTSESYQWGRSEDILGLALGSRKDVIIASKMSRVRETDGADFSAARMVQTVEASLKRLRRDRIEIYQLHSPAREHLETFDWAEGMERLRRQGKIGLGGVAVRSSADGVWLIRQNLVDVLQITYNLLETDAELKLLQLAAEAGVGLLCRMPLAQGILTGKFQAGAPVPAGHRAALAGAALEGRIQRAEALREVGAAYPGGLTRLALHFSLTPQSISAIIPGARDIPQLEENIAASNGAGLDPAVLESLKSLL